MGKVNDILEDEINNERIQQLNIISRLLETKLKTLEHIDQQVSVRRRTNSYRNRGIGEVCRKGHYLPEENKQCLSDVTVRESEETNSIVGFMQALFIFYLIPLFIIHYSASAPDDSSNCKYTFVNGK